MKLHITTKNKLIITDNNVQRAVIINKNGVTEFSPTDSIKFVAWAKSNPLKLQAMIKQTVGAEFSKFRVGIKYNLPQAILSLQSQLLPKLLYTLTGVLCSCTNCSSRNIVSVEESDRKELLEYDEYTIKFICQKCNYNNKQIVKEDSI